MNDIAKRRVAALVCAALLPFTAGCGTMFGGSGQTIRINSSPDGAIVTTTPASVDATTPAALKLQRKQSYVVMLSMPGYTSQRVELKRSIRGGIVALDILGCCLTVVVDAITGGWYKLSPNPASVTLNRLGAGAGPDSITVTLGAKPTKPGADLRVDSTVPGVLVSVRPRGTGKNDDGAASTD